METQSPPQLLKVYLVEDSEIIRQRLHQLLGSIATIQIVGEAEDAGPALEGIDATHAEVAVIDMQLAHSSGLTVLRGLANRAPQVIAIVLTNYATPEFKRECLAAGAQYFFDKTNEFDLVRQTLRNIATAKISPGPCRGASITASMIRV
jgi:two-component system, NarL family, response regulator DevR